MTINAGKLVDRWYI